MDVYEAVISRRSIRRFKDIAVPYDALEKCVNAARLAPSGRNRQLCEYIIIDNEQLLPKVFDSITRWAGQPKPKGALLEHTPKAYIIILINKVLEGEVGNLGRVTTYDVGMSAENVILVALEQGLGSCPILAFEEKELKQILNIPDDYGIALVLALGYPDESPVAEESTGSVERWVDDRGVRHVPKRKLEDILHRNKFQ
jgi:nitroreductase